MASTLTTIPTTQHRYLDPYEQRLFDFNTSDSRVYVSRETNQLLNSLGNDFIISGLTVSKIIRDLTSLEFEIQPGIAIVDTTAIDIQSISTLLIDLTPYDASGKVIVYLSYEYLNTIVSNPVILKVSYLDTNGTTWPDTWNSAKDRIILATCTFTKDESNNITGSTFITTDVTISTIVYKHGNAVSTPLDDYIRSRHVLINEDVDRRGEPVVTGHEPAISLYTDVFVFTSTHDIVVV